MKPLIIDGTKYKVSENMGYNHSIGAYCKMVDTESGERMTIRRQGSKVWRFWTAEDRLGRSRD